MDGGDDEAMPVDYNALSLPELQRLELLQNQHPHIYLHYLQHLEHLQNQYTHHFYLHQLGYWLESQY